MPPSHPPSTTAHVAPAPTKSGMALLSLALAMLLSSLGTSIAHVGLPTLLTVFKASFAEVQWVVLAYLLAITSLIVGAGWLGDRLGRRRLMLAGLALFTLASAACAAAPSLGWLIAARAVQGSAAAVLLALSMALVGDSVVKARQGSAMGLLGSVSALGTALGPSLGGVLIAQLGWPALFLLNLPLGVLALLLAYHALPPDPVPATAPARFDYAGLLLLSATLAAYALGMSWGGGRFGLSNLALLLLAALGLLALLRVEARATAPLLALDSLREPGLASGLVTSLLVASVLMSPLVVGPFYLSHTLGLDAGQLGLAMALGPAGAALAGFPTGRLVDRLGAARLSRLGLLGIGAGCVLLSLLPSALGLPAYLAPLLLITVSYALFQAANNTRVMAGVSAAQRGKTAGLLNLARNLGLISGTALMGTVFVRALPSADLASATPTELATAMQLSFALATVLIALAWWMDSMGRRQQTRPSARADATP